MAATLFQPLPERSSLFHRVRGSSDPLSIAAAERADRFRCVRGSSDPLSGAAAVSTPA